MTKMNLAKQTIDILLVEDNPADVALTREGFREGNFDNNLHVARDGFEAIAFLRRQDPFADAPRPDLILLDLNLPRMNGREVLSEIKNDDRLKSIPVVVLTTSQADEDVSKAYALHANAYMNKPVGFDGFVAVARGVMEYWFHLVRLPR